MSKKILETVDSFIKQQEQLKTLTTTVNDLKKEIIKVAEKEILKDEDVFKKTVVLAGSEQNLEIVTANSLTVDSKSETFQKDKIYKKKITTEIPVAIETMFRKLLEDNEIELDLKETWTVDPKEFKKQYNELDKNIQASVKIKETRKILIKKKVN